MHGARRLGAPPAHLQTPAGDGVDGRRARLAVFVPGGVDGPPCVFAQRVVRREHQAARLRQPHRARLPLHLHLASERAGELVVEPAPGVDAVLCQAGNEGLLIERQQLVAALPRMAHDEARCFNCGVVKVGIHHGIRRQVEELRQGLGGIRETLLQRLQPPKQRLRGRILAVHAQAALGIALGIVDDGGRVFRERENGACLRDQRRGALHCKVRRVFKRRHEHRIAALDLVEQRAELLEVGLQFGGVGGGILARQIPAFALDDRHGSFRRTGRYPRRSGHRTAPAQCGNE